MWIRDAARSWVGIPDFLYITVPFSAARTGRTLARTVVWGSAMLFLAVISGGLIAVTAFPGAVISRLATAPGGVMMTISPLMTISRPPALLSGRWGVVADTAGMTGCRLKGCKALLSDTFYNSMGVRILKNRIKNKNSDTKTLTFCGKMRIFAHRKRDESAFGALSRAFG